MSFEIDISDSTSGQNVDLAKLEAALRHALAVEQVVSAVLSVSVVTNDEIHRLNRQHLQHDYATDVISFQLDWTSRNHATPPVDQQTQRLKEKLLSANTTLKKWRPAAAGLCRTS